MAIAEKLQNIINEKTAQATMTNYGLPSANQINSSTKFIDYPKYIFNAFLEALRNPDTLFTNLPKKSGTGANITLNDTANAPMRVELGASELTQETTTGKNKLPNTSSTIESSGINTTANSDGSVTINGTATKSWAVVGNDYVTVETIPAGTYTFSIQTATTFDIRLDLTYTDDTKQNTFTITAGNTSRTITTEKDIKSIRIEISNGLVTGTTYNQKLYLQLESGSSATSFEKFTYGASPNPSYPQDIHTISGSNTIKVEGKNLLDNHLQPKISNQATASAINTGIRITQINSGTYRYCIIPLFDVSNYVGQKLTFHSDITSSASNKGRANVILCDVDGNNRTTIDGIIATGSLTFTVPSLTAPSTFIGLTLYSNTDGTSSANDYTDFTNLQLEKGNSPTTFQPYVAPQTADIDLPVENLFMDNFIPAPDQNINAKLKTGTYTLTTCDSDNFGTNVYIKLYKNNVAITTSGHLTGINTTLSFSTSSYNYYGGNDASYITFTIDDDYDIAIGLLNSTETRQVMLTKGSKIARKYTPYGTTPIQCGSIGNYENIPIRTFGKNLFDKNTDDYKKGYYLDSNGIEQSGANWGVYYIKVKPSTDYTISGCQANGGVNFCWFTDNKTFISNIGTKQNRTMTSPNNAGYLGLSIVWNTESTAYDTNIMLNKGSTALDYEPYGNGTWYLKQEIGKVVLDGTELNWSKSGNTTFDRFLLGNNIHGIVSAGGYSNYFKVVNINVASNLHELSNNGNSQIVINYSNYGETTLEQFKTWLGTHNVIFNYVMETPTYTQITGALAEQLENVYQKMLSYSGQTNISQINNDLGFILNTQVLQDLS